MHDPMTVAHEIYLGRKKKKDGRYRNPFITIWHIDPEKDGTDDSCGWFIRKRHLPADLVDKVRKEFAFNFQHNYWFNESGYPIFSVSATALNMFYIAVWNLFMWMDGNNPTSRARRRTDRFMKKHLWEILHFAENPTDSIGTSITMKYGVKKKEERIEHFVSIVLPYIMRKLRPWYKHPRWHIHHWKVVFHPWQNFKRRYWDKCSVCGKRGFKGQAAIGDWDGTKIWHQGCDTSKRENTSSESD